MATAKEILNVLQTVSGTLTVSDIDIEAVAGED